MDKNALDGMDLGSDVSEEQNDELGDVAAETLQMSQRGNNSNRSDRREPEDDLEVHMCITHRT